MFEALHSSRRRFDDYRRRRKERLKQGHAAVSDDALNLRGTSRSRSAWVLLKEFFKIIGSDRPVMFATMVALTFSTLLALVPLYGTKIVFDYVLSDHPLPAHWEKWIILPTDRGSLLSTVALGMIGFALTALMLGMWSRWQATRATMRTQVNVRRKVFEHAVRLPLHRVYELKSGGVASILREDAGGVGNLMFSMLFNPWKAIIQLLGSLIVLTFTDWRLLLGSLVLLPIVFFSHRTWISRIRPLWRDIRATRQNVDAGATEAFGGMRVVRSFVRQKTEATQFARSNHLMVRLEMLAWWWSRTIDIAWSVLIPAASAALLWYGGMRILQDMASVNAGTMTFEESLTIGDLVMFLSYLAALLGPLAMLAVSATSFQNNLAALDRILDLLAEPQEMPPKPTDVRLDPKQVVGHVRFEQVSFAYHGTDALVLQDINIDAQPGKMIALVGPSGAGKTTLCNLVARFYDPTQGRVTIDGMDLCNIRVDSYRGLLGIVEQDIFLFDGTVSQNIGYGKRGASQEDIIHAATLANADNFIRDLPKAYDTLIGERGVKLSGGQRQRLAIARAILADPRILILDEATSNLDTDSERLIQLSMQTLMTDRTSFVIAHRLSTIAHADTILVIENGRIIEQGQHNQLLERSGRYKEMVALQTAPPALLDSEKQTASTTSGSCPR